MNHASQTARGDRAMIVKCRGALWSSDIVRDRRVFRSSPSPSLVCARYS